MGGSARVVGIGKPSHPALLSLFSYVGERSIDADRLVGDVQAVTAPAETSSPMQLEAHYKLVLVNLIIEGKVRPGPASRGKCPGANDGSSLASYLVPCYGPCCYPDHSTSLNAWPSPVAPPPADLRLPLVHLGGDDQGDPRSRQGVRQARHRVRAEERRAGLHRQDGGFRQGELSSSVLALCQLLRTVADTFWVDDRRKTTSTSCTKCKGRSSNGRSWI